MTKRNLFIGATAALAAVICLAVGLVYVWMFGWSTETGSGEPKDASTSTSVPPPVESSFTRNPVPTLLNEIVLNPNGEASNCRYVELKGEPNGSLKGLHFMVVDGDAGTSMGVAEFVVDMTGGELGSNGLAVLTGSDTEGTCDERDYGAPSGTHVFRLPDITDSKILESGTRSYLLVYSPTTEIVPGMDLDSNDDGAIDRLPGNAVILDGIGWTDGGAGDKVYVAVLPPIAGGALDMATRFPNAATPKSSSAWYWGGIGPGDASSASSLVYNRAKVSPNFPSDGALTPGLPNVGTPTISGPIDGGKGLVSSGLNSVAP